MPWSAECGPRPSSCSANDPSASSAPSDPVRRNAGCRSTSAWARSGGWGGGDLRRWWRRLLDEERGAICGGGQHEPEQPRKVSDPVGVSVEIEIGEEILGVFRELAEQRVHRALEGLPARDETELRERGGDGPLAELHLRVQAACGERCRHVRRRQDEH